MEFRGTKNKELLIVVDAKDEIPICPRCGFPNRKSAQNCEECVSYPLLDDGNVQWVRAGLLTHKCPNPNCSAYLTDAETICKICGYNLQAEIEQPVRDADVLTPTHPVYIRVCPVCRSENPPTAKKCSNINCKADISDVFPELKETQAHRALNADDSISVHLNNIRTGQTVELKIATNDDLMIGRSGLLAEQLQGDDYVGREHFHLTRQGATVYIRDESRNGTFINGIRLAKGQRIALQSGVTVGLGDSSPSECLAAFFEVSY